MEKEKSVFQSKTLAQLGEGGPAALVGEGNNRVGLVVHLCGLGAALI